MRDAVGVLPPPGHGRQDEVLASLRRPAAFGPGCRSVETLETHISHVFLAGELAYKVKKAVRLPFLDFTTLEARRHYCEQELALNRRTAPKLYLDVVPVVERGNGYAIGGDGPPVEWAVRMRRFAQDALLSRMLERGELAAAHVDSLAANVAAFHARIADPRRPVPHGTPQDALRLALDNFRELDPFFAAPAARSRLDALRDWTLAEHAARAPLMAQRVADGFVRECHGDLHLANVAWVDGEATPFDCIEFDPAMRWSDVMSDVAFAAMDLRARGRPDLARRFVDRYLGISGDYGGVPVLAFHLVYRAVVRAKIACIRAAQAGPEAAAASRREALDYLDLATGLARPRRRALVVMHGLSGCGKSVLSQALVEAADIVRIRMDVERKRAHGLAANARSGSGIVTGLYAPDVTRQAYARVAATAETIVTAGAPVVVDAACLHRWQRDLFRAVARRCDAAFFVVDLPAPAAVLRERVARRSAAGRDASEADVAVLEHQLASYEPLGADEACDTIAFDAALPIDATTASSRWRDWIAALTAPDDEDGPPAARNAAPDPGVATKVAFLTRPSSYPERPSRVDVVETHLSWVFLTDANAWKLKKPVRLDSLDYRTVEARHRNVADEIRLNRRLATDVYLGEAALVRRGDGTLALDGAGTVVDWLVKMRRLPADRMLDALIRRGALQRRDIAAIMAVLMRFYEQAPVATLSAGEYRRRLGDAVGTTRDALLRPDYALPAEAVELPAARQWRFLDRAAAAFDARVAHGRIVEAHGDLRPEHVCVEDEPQFIDCLEFSQDLRIQDIADELGFLALECERLGEPGLREAIFAAYADASGDAPPDALVHFHQSCRAYVRALIAIRHLDDARVRDPSRWRAQALDYLRLAREHAARCE